MHDHRSPAQLLEAATAGLPVPRLAKAGAALIAAGLLVDLVVHTVLHSAHDELIGAFPVQEHFAHLVVVIGMVLVLAGIVADGVRRQRRQVRQEGTIRHAIR
jgi:uncharacterized protein YjeT (DUF2065 family)